jgi:hypothetical protein
MEIEIFTLCDYAAEGQPGKLTIVGTFDTLHCQQVPVVHPNCSIAIRVRMANKDVGRHDLEIKFQSPSGQEISKIQGQLNTAPNPFTGYTTTNLVINFANLELKEVGKYTFELWLDGDFQSGLSMHVLKRDPPKK